MAERDAPYPPGVGKGKGSSRHAEQMESPSSAPVWDLRLEELVGGQAPRRAVGARELRRLGSPRRRDARRTRRVALGDFTRLRIHHNAPTRVPDTGTSGPLNSGFLWS